MGRKLWLTTSAAVLLWAGAAQAQDATTHALKLEPDNPIALKMNERLAAVPGQR